MDRRKYKRISRNLFLWYIPNHEEIGFKFFRVVIVKNLSSRGILFTSDEYLPLNTSLYMELKIPNISKRINLSGEVSRVVSEENFNFYTVAVRFSQEEPKLTDFINTTLNVESI